MQDDNETQNQQEGSEEKDNTASFSGVKKKSGNQNRNNTKSSIELLNDRLNSRDPGQKIAEKDHFRLKENIPKISQEWEEEEKLENSPMKKKRRTYLKIFTYSAILFFLISVAIAAYVFFGGLNKVSSENILINLKGDASVPAGKIYNFTLTIENTNRVSLEKSNITVTYPNGSRNSENSQKEVLRDKRDIGLVPSSAVAKQDYSVILYGDKGTKKTFAIDYEYTVPGSTSTFVKKQDFEITIDASPITVEVNTGSEFTTGQDMVSKVTVSSNTDTTVKDIILIAEYPFGFDFKSASPEPSSEKNVWYLGSIEPNEKREITITGAVSGSAQDERTLRFRVGVSDSNNRNNISSLISESSKTYSIINPLLAVGLSLNGRESGEVVVDMGRSILAEAIFANNLDSVIENGTVEISVPDGIVDDSTIKVKDGGFYRSTDRKIVWDKNSNTSLRSVAPGAKIKLSFEVGTVNAFSSTALSQRKPELVLEAHAYGQTTDNRGVNGEVSSDISRTIKINSKLTLQTNSLYSNTSFANTGPLPPRVNNKTSYTITWSLSNSYNPLSKTYVIAKLPPYVEWKNNISPSTEQVVYNPETRQVLWSIGRLEAGIGQNTSPREVSFQIEMTPSISQVETVPVLVESPTANATDDFTGIDITSIRNSITTLIINDALYQSGFGVVAP